MNRLDAAGEAYTASSSSRPGATGGHLIRPATLADLPSIDELANEILAKHGLPEDSAVAALDAGYFSADGAVVRGSARFWVAVTDGEVIGSAAVVPGSGLRCTFKTFYVQEAYRGRRVGYDLYICAERFARSARYRGIELYVSRRFRKAMRFYSRNGYQLVEELSNAWEDSLYRKNLWG